MKRFWPLIQIILVIWGLFCLVAALGVAGFVAYSIGPGNQARSHPAAARNVHFILNHAELGQDRLAEVLHSYQSPRSFTGDHLDAHVLRITHLEESELTLNEFGRGWTRCDQADPILRAALDFLVGWLDQEEIPWFLKAEDLQSDTLYVYPWRILFHGPRPTSVQLIFVRPADLTVFYLSCKT